MKTLYKNGDSYNYIGKDTIDDISSMRICSYTEIVISEEDKKNIIDEHP